MQFLNGLKGMLGGIVIMLFGSLLFGSAATPLMLDVWSTVTVLGFAVFVGSPMYYWVYDTLKNLRRENTDPLATE